MLTGNLLKKFISIVVMLLMTIFSAACQRDSEQGKIRKIITKVQNAAEEKNIRTVLDSVSKAYRDPQGYDYDGIKGLLLSYFYRHQKISVYIENIDVTVDVNSARATFQAVLSAHDTAGSVADVLPQSLGVYAFDVVFSKESKEWKVASAKWNRLGDAQSGDSR